MGQVLKQRYELLHELGRGAFAVTHLALDLATGQKCVAKLLSFTREQSPRALELFEREARVLAHLRHPRIPRFVEFFTEETADDVVAVLVQQHLEGTDLARRVRDARPCSEAEAVAIGREVASILEHLHAFQPPILHRDVKPSNVLLAPDGSAWLIDFGAVRDTLLHDPLLVPGGPTVVGTFGYMPPEQFHGEAEPASDVYGLAATLAYALSGLEPWELDKQEMRPVLRSRIPASEPLLRVLERALEPDPRHRFASARAFREALEAVAARPAPLAVRPAVRGVAVIVLAWTAAAWLITRPQDPAARVRPPLSPAAQRAVTGHDMARASAPEPALRPSVPWPLVAHDEAGEPLPPGVVRRLGTRRLRHGGPVRAVVLTPDGRTVISGGADGILSLWDAATGVQRQALAAYAPIVDLAVSEDGRRLGAGLADATARVFALPSGQPLARLHLSPDEGTHRLAVAFASGDRVATATPRGALDFWSLSRAEAHLRQVTACAATPWALDRKAGGFELGCGRDHLTIDPVTGVVQARVALDRTGDFLVRQRGGGWWGSSGTEAWRLDASGRATETSFRLHSNASALAVSADGRVGALGLADGTRVVFDAVRGAQQRMLEGHVGAVLAVALSADGRLLASGGEDHTVRVADLVAGTEVESPGLRHAVEALAFSASGGSLFSGSAEGQFVEWGIDGRPREQHSVGGAVRVVAPLDRSRTLVGERSGVGRNEHPDRLARLRVFAGFAAVREIALPANASGYAIAAPAARLATATATHVHTYSLADADDRHASWATPAPERPVAFSPDGRVLATARDEGNFEVSLVLRDADSGRQLGRSAMGRGGPGIVPCRGADGSFLLAGGSLYRVASAPQPRIHYAGVVGGAGDCAVSPDGKQVATIAVDRIQWHAVRLEDSRRGREMWRQAWLHGHRGRVTALAFSPDGRLLASGGFDTRILVWDLKAIADELGDERPVAAPLWPPLTGPPSAAGVTIDFDGPEKGVTPWHARPSSGVPAPVLRGRALDTRAPRVYPEARDVRLGDAWSITATFRLPAVAFPLPPFLSLLRSEALFLYLQEGAARLVLGFLNQGGHAGQDLTPWTGSLKPEHDYHLAVNYDRTRGRATICVDAACAPGPASPHLADRLGELTLGDRDPKGHAFALLDDVRILARELTDAEIARAAGRAAIRARDAEARP